jgi:hypothetical protein
MKNLGYVVSAGKNYGSTKKLENVADWLVPKTQKEVRSYATSTPSSSIMLGTLRLH